MRLPLTRQYLALVGADNRPVAVAPPLHEPPAVPGAVADLDELARRANAYEALVAACGYCQTYASRLPGEAQDFLRVALRLAKE